MLLVILYVFLQSHHIHQVDNQLQISKQNNYHMLIKKRELPASLALPRIINGIIVLQSLTFSTPNIDHIEIVIPDRPSPSNQQILQQLLFSLPTRLCSNMSIVARLLSMHHIGQHPTHTILIRSCHIIIKFCIALPHDLWFALILVVCQQSLYVPNTSSFQDDAHITMRCPHNHELMRTTNFAAGSKTGAILDLIYFVQNQLFIWIHIDLLLTSVIKINYCHIFKYLNQIRVCLGLEYDPN